MGGRLFSALKCVAVRGPEVQQAYRFLRLLRSLCLIGSPRDAVCVRVWLWAGWQSYRGSMNSGGKIFFSSANRQAGSGAHITSYTGSLFTLEGKVAEA